MDNLLNIEDLLQTRRRRRELENKTRKVQALRKLVQCTSCRLRCAMCGCRVDSGDMKTSGFEDLEFVLCESCRTDFDDYKAAFEKKRVSECFWHNKEWMALWSSWIGYQRSIRGFIDSEEFKQLMNSFCR
ncbi:MAG TPA: hypothetical protein ENN79_00110 [Desulfobacteraceae bacterium]|nr:hypothetical protein [Desulfobacteraceae bacterium]